MHRLRPVFFLVASVALSALAAALSSGMQGSVPNGGTVGFSEEGGPYAVQGAAWDEAEKTCSASFQVEDPSDTAIAIVRASSGYMSVTVNGIAVEPKDYTDARQASVVSLAGIGLESGSGSGCTVDLEVSTGRWDSSDQVYVGSESAVVDTFVVEYRVVNAIAMATLAVMVLYGSSLYLSKKTESYLRPFIAYTLLLSFWLIMTNAPRSEALAPELFDFMQVCGHFYVAYIPFAICVILSGHPVARRSSFFFRWQGLLLVPLACGALGFFTSFGATMAVVLAACLLYGGRALVSSSLDGVPGANVLIVGFGVTMGLKIMAVFVDYGLVADSMVFFTMRKTRFLNVFVLLAIMVFLNRRFAANFTKTEDQSALLDSMVVERTAELERQQGLRLGMMANIFHDLRTPLFVIKSCVEDIEASGGADASATALLKDRVSLLSRLIDDLFTASKLEDDDVMLAEEPVDLQRMVRAVADAARPIAARSRVSLDCEAEERYFTWGDPYYLARALGNLVENAIQHAPEKSSVSVQLRREREKALVSVHNGGAGIDPEDLPRIFERYYHRSERASANASSGLGLSIAQSVVRKHRGDILVESEPGRGCTFTASFPILPQEASGQEHSPSQENV